MSFSLKLFAGRSMKIAALALAMTLPLSAHAHRQWLLPSATVLSGNDAWVTVDAAVSNDLFYFEHFPLRLDGLVVTGPEGKPVPAVNAATGQYRSTLDGQLNQSGTYKIAVVTTLFFAATSWMGSKNAAAAMPTICQGNPGQCHRAEGDPDEQPRGNFVHRRQAEPLGTGHYRHGTGIAADHPSQRPGGR